MLIIILISTMLSAVIYNNQSDIVRSSHKLSNEFPDTLSNLFTMKKIVSDELMTVTETFLSNDLDAYKEKHEALDINFNQVFANLHHASNLPSTTLKEIDTKNIALHNNMLAIMSIAQNHATTNDHLELEKLLVSIDRITDDLQLEIDKLVSIIETQIGETHEQLRSDTDQTLLLGILLSLCVIAMLVVLLMNNAALNRAHKREQNLSYYPERSPEAVMTVDSKGNILYANPRAYHILSLLKLNDDELNLLLPVSLKSIIADLRSKTIAGDDWQDTDRHTSHWSHHIKGVIFQTTLQWLEDCQRGHLYFHDITRAEAMQKRLNYLAYFDPLTQLPNRRRFEEEIENIVNLNIFGKPQSWSVGIIRLDRFAHVTTGHGYHIGDKLIAAAGARLKETLTEFHDAHIYRFDGARFGILVLKEQCDEIIEKMNSSMMQPIVIEDTSFYLTLSIGLTETPSEESDTSTQLIVDAGAALERASEMGGNHTSKFSSEMRIHEIHIQNMEVKLRDSLYAGNLDLYYQPQVDTISGELVGMEALVRWQREDGTFVPPSEFIPIAERIGLIVVLGEWVINKAFKQAALWQEMFGKRCVIGVNISSRQFSHVHFLEILENALNMSSVDPRLIEIEITESVMMENIDNAQKVISKIKQMGMSISIDDFGTGYSSMSYLKDLNVDKIKVDREFVKGITSEETEEIKRDKSIVRSIVDLGHNLGMKVIAEGVDNTGQIEFLKSIGCDQLQGFIISKPYPPHQVEHFLSGELPPLIGE